MDKFIAMLTDLWSWLQVKFEETSIWKGVLVFIVAMFVLSLLGFFSEIIGPVVTGLMVLFLGYKIYQIFKQKKEEEPEPEEEQVEEETVEPVEETQDVPVEEEAVQTQETVESEIKEVTVTVEEVKEEIAETPA